MLWRKEYYVIGRINEKAKDSGVNITACTMSMDVMGISKEELIDGINYGGVGQYLGETENQIIIYLSKDMKEAKYFRMKIHLFLLLFMF